MYILVTMILLYGYAANATGIGIEEGGEAIEAEAGEGGEGGYYFAPDAHVGIRSAIGLCVFHISGYPLVSSDDRTFAASS